MKQLLCLSFLYGLVYIIAVGAKAPVNHGNEWQIVGDMILSPLQTEFLYSHSRFKNAEIDARRRWNNATIPYEFSSDFTEEDRAKIVKVLNTAFSKTCAKFRPRNPTDIDYVLLVNEGACFSNVGRTGGMQKISLETKSKSSSVSSGGWISISYIPSCINDQAIAHEFLHALGLFHQHSASNRDDYVTVKWENIDPAFKTNFDKYEANRISDYGQPYDYDSIMHYPKYAGSINGQPTLIPKRSNTNIGDTTLLSKSDIIKVNKMYNCKMG